MFSIMSDKVVTNLRVDKVQWQQIKILAAEEEMSVNEYMNYILRKIPLAQQLGILNKGKKAKANKKYSFWDLPERLASMKNEPMGKMSEEDEIIYG